MKSTSPSPFGDGVSELPEVRGASWAGPLILSWAGPLILKSLVTADRIFLKNPVGPFPALAAGDFYPPWRMSIAKYIVVEKFFRYRIIFGRR
jgi:hypothetical protein